MKTVKTAKPATQAAAPSIAAQILTPKAYAAPIQKWLDANHDAIAFAAQCASAEVQSIAATDGAIGRLAIGFRRDMETAKQTVKEFLKGNAASNLPRQQLAASFEMILPHVTEGTRAAYASNFWKCFEDDVEFNRNYSRAKADKGPTKKPGKPEAATLNDFAKAAVKLYNIAEILGKLDSRFNDFAELLAESADDLVPEWQKVEE